MAFTEQNKADAYLFFVLAFNAAPGTVYGGQIVQAYEAGLTTADIVAQYVEKPAFTSLYPTTQTASEFATALVNNVSSSGTTAAVKASAVADIETALAAGWTKAQVVTQILGNLANKTVADTAWGQTVAQLNNKIAVAKALTEGPLALTSEDAAVLQGPLSSVTFDQATVQPAINGAGSAAVKLEALVTAKKAHADFLKAGDFADALAVEAKVTAAVNKIEGADVLNNGAFSAIVDKKETVSAAMQAAIISDAKKAFADDVTAKTTALDTAKNTWLDANTTNKTLKVQLDAFLKAAATATTASTASTDAATAQGTAVTALNGTTTVANSIAATAVDADTGVTTATIGGVAAVEIINVQSGKLALTKAFTDVADAKQLTAATKLLDSIVAAQTAKANATAATDAEAAAKKVITDTTIGGVAATDPAAVKTAAGALKTSQDKTPALDKALKAYNDTLANLTKEVALDKAIKDAEKAFTDAGQNVPVTIDGGVITTAGANLFVLDGVAAPSKTLVGFAADDKIFAGKGYTVSADITKGDDSKLEVFFKANGASTDVYIEQKAFGSNTTAAADGNADFIKITLTGVAADKLVLKDGFVTVAA